MVLPILTRSASEHFLADHQAGKPARLWYKLLCDTETPLAIYAKLQQRSRYSYILESVQGGENRGRYTLMGSDPDLLWRCRLNQAEECHRLASGTSPAVFHPCPDSPRDSLQRILDASRVEHDPDLPLLSAMVVGYLGYDCVRWKENIPDKNPDFGRDDALMMRPQIVLVYDTVSHIISLVALCYPTGNTDSEAALTATRQRLDQTLADLEAPLPTNALTAETTDTLPVPEQLTHLLDRDQYLAMVERAREYIRAGDVYQVVLSQRFTMPFALPALTFFRELRRTNPSPYLFFLDCDDFAVVGSSPELMVRLRDETVTIRPIAGTRRRGHTPAEDLHLAEDLLADQKERAEHLMLLDLGRNDASQVTDIGSVRVTESFAVERYSHVMHIVSNVEGHLAPGQRRLDALMAGFPAGTVSGAPKIRAMEIIDELEPLRRGIYAGCVGYFDGAGNMDNCIALRTAVIQNNELIVQAGAGIVADSNPAAEYQECVNKAKALLVAAQAALKNHNKLRQS